MDSLGLQNVMASQPAVTGSLLSQEIVNNLSADEEAKIRAIERRMLDAVDTGDLDWICNFGC
ncbi:hypothetical protein C0Z18_28555 [Trinickia dabaoshanensis]|uniref:Uncharacterized protein n=1 Tax=Trinickia dabaoshanensis TaxID=564714 RepID=A0A2N7VDB1_9BURK|nr:hypothetical protein [Trinickia dabaoshanensis]PMS15117.1 hypothetical protein C0Z18_28555 [Trinickia dabaoshanensis]